MMLVYCVSEFMHDDVVSEIWWESHELDIQADRISVTTAPPSGFLMTTRHALVLKSELGSQLHRPVWKK